MGLFRRRPKHILDDVEQAVLTVIAAYQLLYRKPLPGRRKLVSLLAALKFLGNPSTRLNARFYVHGLNIDSPQVRRAIFYLQEYGLLREKSEYCNRDIDVCDEAGNINVYYVTDKAMKMVPRSLLDEAVKIVRIYGDKHPQEIIREILHKHNIPEYYLSSGSISLEDLIAASRGFRGSKEREER